jgi:glycosyltransferase involved in cell wall biosynthesis
MMEKPSRSLSIIESLVLKTRGRDRSRFPRLLPIFFAGSVLLGAGGLGYPSTAHADSISERLGRCRQWFTEWTIRSPVPEIVAAAENASRSGTRFPKDFTDAERAALLKEFTDDGRPILVVTDAHYGQKSGVVTVMKVLKEQIEKLTHGKVSLHYVMPDQFRPQLAVDYQDLIFSYMSSKAFDGILKKVDPQAVHVMVEGALGTQARGLLRKRKIPFTTAYHTMFPEYVRDMVAKYAKPLAEPIRKLVNANLRKFHGISEGVMVPTESMAKNLIEGGYEPERLRYWSHGVDADLFHPSKADPTVYAGLPRPISVFIGRVAVEKNLEDFLKMDIPGTKVVVGSGPELETFKTKYPKAVFLGRKNYEELPKYYASSDVFVFPSLTDTFGLVQLEANATGVPVAAYRVQGPVDVITSPQAGVLADYDAKNSAANVRNLTRAWEEARKIKREDARRFAEDHTWEKSALEFLYFLRRTTRGGGAKDVTPN